MRGKQGGCCRQLVSQLTPVTKEDRVAGSGDKVTSWSRNWPHCMNMSERSWSLVSCSLGKRTMALETSRAYKNSWSQQRPGACISRAGLFSFHWTLTRGTLKPLRLTLGVQPKGTETPSSYSAGSQRTKARLEAPRVGLRLQRSTEGWPKGSPQAGPSPPTPHLPKLCWAHTCCCSVR